MESDSGDLQLEELRARIRQLEEELESGRQREEQILHIVNEMNNLLAVMRGHAQLAGAEPGGEEHQNLSRIVLSGTARAQEIVKRLLSRGAFQSPAAEKLMESVRAARASILVVDDEESMGLLMQRLLTKAGHDVTVASSGRKALEAARSKVFDLMFLDIVLGDLHGVDVFRQVRQISPDTRVVFLSGDPSIKEVMRTVRDEGADGFITKPFDILEIQDLVTYILKRSAADTPVQPEPLN
jgi:CheY-like chemotaxis protein